MAHTNIPELQLASNGRDHVLAGTGECGDSRWDEHDPRCPEVWPSFGPCYRDGETIYRITLLQPHAALGGSGWTLEGIPGSSPAITLVDDRRKHSVIVPLQVTGVTTCKSA